MPTKESSTGIARPPLHQPGGELLTFATGRLWRQPPGEAFGCLPKIRELGAIGDEVGRLTRRLLQPRRNLVVGQASGNKSVSRIGLRCAHPCSFCLGARSIRRGAPRQEVCLGQRRIFQLYAGQGENLMQPSLRPGASRTNRIVVGRERTIAFLGEEARTYATPSMILDIEHTCRELILEHADAGEDSVGMEVAIKHLAPTLMGMTAEITVRATSVEGRKVVFDVVVKDELDTVGAGTRTRFVVEKAKTLERLKAKAARLTAHKG